jgi:hypothetical protein
MNHDHSFWYDSPSWEFWQFEFAFKSPSEWIPASYCLFHESLSFEPIIITHQLSEDSKSSETDRHIHSRDSTHRHNFPISPFITSGNAFLFLQFNSHQTRAEQSRAEQSRADEFLWIRNVWVWSDLRNGERIQKQARSVSQFCCSAHSFCQSWQKSPTLSISASLRSAISWSSSVVSRHCLQSFAMVPCQPFMINSLFFLNSRESARTWSCASHAFSQSWTKQSKLTPRARVGSLRFWSLLRWNHYEYSCIHLLQMHRVSINTLHSRTSFQTRTLMVWCGCTDSNIFVIFDG